MTEELINHEGAKARREKEERKSLFSFPLSLRAFVPSWLTTTLPAKADTLAVAAGAFKEGVAYHWAVAREALNSEKAAPRRDPFTAAQLAFLPAALEVVETPAAPVARWTAIVIAAFFTLAVAWACVGELDIVAVATGKLIPSERVKVIQPLETSIVRQVLVAEAEEVKAGQVLVELEAVGAQADLDRLMGELDSTRADIARLKALQAADPIKAFAPPRELPAHLVELQRSLLATQWREHLAQIARLDSDLAQKQAEIKTIEAEIARLSSTAAKIEDATQRRQELAAKGYGSQIARLDSEKELAENRGQQQVQRARLVETRAAIESLKSQSAQARAEFVRDAAAKQAEARAKADSTQQELFKAAERQKVQSLRAPADGVVQQIKIHTVGGVVQPAQELMVVVPKGAVLEVDAKLPNKDIAFVDEGQEAEVKVDAFPFTRYGTIPARVETVSLDAVKDEDSQAKDYVFPLRLSLAQDSITVEIPGSSPGTKRIPLTPGMTVVAEVKTGTRRPIEYVLAPLKKYGAESGRER